MHYLKTLLRSLKRMYFVHLYVIVTVLTLLLDHVHCAQEGDIQLVGGPSKYEGNVFIYHLGSWGIVCDDDWSMNNARVACKQLGYGAATKHTKYNKYKTQKRRIWKDNVKCKGVETVLASCPSNPWAIHNCNTKEAAGVQCSPPRGNANLQSDAHGIREYDLVPAEDRENGVRRPLPNMNEFFARARENSSGNLPATLAAILRRRYTQARARITQSTRQGLRQSTLISRETTTIDEPSTTPPTTTTAKTTTTKTTTTPVASTPTPTLTTKTTTALTRKATTAVTTTPKPTTPAKPTTTSYKTTTTTKPTTTKPVPTRSRVVPRINILSINDWINPPPPKYTSRRPAFKSFTVQQVQDEMSKQADSAEVEEQDYKVRLMGGRTLNEGRVEVFVGGKWQTVCGHQWGIFETMVVCRQLGQGYAQNAVKVNHFGGERMTKAFAAIQCVGHEKSLDECIHIETVEGAICSRKTSVAGALCAKKLPDLKPNVTLLMDTVRLEDRSLFHLQCAMEENCVSSTAYDIRSRYPGAFHSHTRRLLRFSSSVANVGTADFHPHIPKERWEWHLCHMHYHSMDVFAHYDIYDQGGRRVAEGHKASFCLEDTDCQPGVKPFYQCVNSGDQGIRVGCADTYAHDIDCQWIDITDLKPGIFRFTININPEFKVAELDYENNQVTCKLVYNGFTAKFTDCTLARGTPRGIFAPSGRDLS